MTLIYGPILELHKAEERAEKLKMDCMKAEARNKDLEDRVHELSHLATCLKRELEEVVSV